jgi:hypothetical protein
MPLDRARADEEPRADLRIRQAVPGEPGDLVLLGSEPVTRLDAARPHLLARCDQLPARSLGVRLVSHVVEHAVGQPQLDARIDAAILAPKPLAVHETRARA